MTDITGPDGGPLAFATHKEADAYRALREAEPPLLKFLRRHRAEVLHLCRLAHDALAQPHGCGCSAALEDIERRHDRASVQCRCRWPTHGAGGTQREEDRHHD